MIKVKTIREFRPQAELARDRLISCTRNRYLLPRLRSFDVRHISVSVASLIAVMACGSSRVSAVTVSVSPSFNYVVTDGGGGGYEAFPTLPGSMTAGSWRFSTRVTIIFHRRPPPIRWAGGQCTSHRLTRRVVEPARRTLRYAARRPRFLDHTTPGRTVTLDVLRVCRRPDARLLCRAVHQRRRHMVDASTFGAGALRGELAITPTK